MITALDSRTVVLMIAGFTLRGSGRARNGGDRSCACRHFEDWQEGANAPRRAALTLTRHRYRWIRRP
jgi:hypothetical protein